MEVAMEVIDQDDVFFADLSKQISLLIMDDEDLPDRPSASFQVFSRVIHPSTQSQVFYEQTSRRDQSKGTGVFIPRSTQPGRKSKQGRFSTTTSSNTKFHQKLQSDNSKGVPHNHLPSNSYTSFNHKRT